MIFETLFLTSIITDASLGTEIQRFMTRSKLLNAPADQKILSSIPHHDLDDFVAQNNQVDEDLSKKVFVQNNDLADHSKKVIDNNDCTDHSNEVADHTDKVVGKSDQADLSTEVYNVVDKFHHADLTVVENNDQADLSNEVSDERSSNNLINEVADLRVSINQKDRDLDNLKVVLSQKNEVISSLQSSLKQQSTTSKKLRSELQEETARANALRAENLDLVDEKSHLKVELGIQSDEFQRLEEAFKRKEKGYETANNWGAEELRMVQKEYYRLKESSESLEKELFGKLKKQEEEIKALLLEVKTLKGANKDLKDTNRKQKDDIKSGKSQLREAEYATRNANHRLEYIQKSQQLETILRIFEMRKVIVSIIMHRLDAIPLTLFPFRFPLLMAKLKL